MTDQSPPEPVFGVACGKCGGTVCMVTCNHFRGTGHEWVIVSVCLLCRNVYWTDSGCLDCGGYSKTAALSEDSDT